MLRQIMFLIVGIGSLSYYAALCAAARKWDSTFTRFWLVCGVGSLCALKIMEGQHEFVMNLLSFIMVLLLIYIAIAEVMIIRGMAPDSVRGIPYIIVLGAQVKGTTITDSLLRRLDRAIGYLEQNPGTCVIVSGGQGPQEDIAEARAMADYLMERGIGSDRISEESMSTTTKENLARSIEYAGGGRVPVGIVTNNFHMYRACLYARKTGYTEVHAIPAGCRKLWLVNYMVREAFALGKFCLDEYIFAF